MPRKMDMAEELRLIDAQIETDPSFRFPIMGKCPAVPYRKLIAEALASGVTLTRMLEIALTDRYDSTQFSVTTQEALKALCILWETDQASVVNRLVEQVALDTLRKEIAVREEVASIGQRATKLKSVKP